MSPRSLSEVAGLRGVTPAVLAEQVLANRQRPGGHPWYITALLTGGGWIAALFSALAIGAFMMILLNVADQEVAKFGAGVMVIGLILYRVVHGEFLRAYANAAILGGYVLCVVMAYEMNLPSEVEMMFGYLAALAGIVAIVALTKDFSLHFIGVLICHLGLLIPILLDWGDSGVQYRLAAGTLALPVGLWLFTVMWKHDVRGVAYGLILIAISSTLPGELAGIIDDGHPWENIVQWGGKAGAGMALAWLFWRFRAEIPLPLMLSPAVFCLLVILLLPAYGAAAIAVMAYAVMLGHRPLAIGAVLLTLWSVSRFYYDLSSTLLFKSGLMIVVGLILVIAWYSFFYRRGIRS